MNRDRFNTYIERLGITLLPYQSVLVDELFKFPHNARVTQCRQSGKSFILALVIYFLAYTEHWDVVITAPKIDQTKWIMNPIRKIQEKVKAKTYNRNIHSIDMINRGSIVCLSGSETANVEGASAHLLVVDEHQDLLRSHVGEVFVPMLTWHDGLYWSCGIGSLPGSVASRDELDLDWNLPWQDVIKVKPDYENKVNLARRENTPEVFRCHYECKPLDTSGALLIPIIYSYNNDINDGHIRVGIDWGKRTDQSVATAISIKEDMIYIIDWLVPTGSYDEQIDQLVNWLQNDIEYDEVISEDVGVGDSATDILIRRMKDPKGFESGVSGHGVSTKWKSKQAMMIHKRAGNKTLLYNDNHDISEVFRKDITSLGYKMLDSNLIKPDHSDFLSSLMLAIEEPGTAYV